MMFIDSILDTLSTGNGLWNPLVWIVAIIIAYLVIYIIRGFGKREYKKDTEQTKVFLSGNPEYKKEEMHVKSSNVYWGFTEALSWVYRFLDKMHTGNVSDYILWFVIVMGTLFLILGVI